MDKIKGSIIDLRSTEKGIKIFIKPNRIIHADYPPYFYLVAKNPAVTAEEIKTMPEIKNVELVEKKYENEPLKLIKITVRNPSDVIKLRGDLDDLGEPHEADIPHAFRFLIDNNLYPLKEYEFTLENGLIKKSEKTSESEPELKLMGFDIETYNKQRTPEPNKDPVLMIGHADEKGSDVIYWTKQRSSEKTMFSDFMRTIEKKDPDVLIGYNSSGFDVPYLKKRADELGIEFDLSRDGSGITIKRGAFSTRAHFFGRIHYDAYDGVSFLNTIGAMNIPKNDLESVYKEMFGKEKLDIDASKLWQYWENDLEKVVQYNKEDAIAAYEIGRDTFPLYLEISKIIGLPPYETTRMSTSQMIEWLLVREAYEQNELVPNTPDEKTVKTRLMNPIKGAFVKLPKSGLHEKIAVCDFRSLYPSLIITYNIDKNSYNCQCCKEPHVSPMGHKFCSKKPGLVPKIIKELISKRIEVKKEMKKHKRGSMPYKAKHYQQWALKIIANSAYGYLGYSRAKWYSRESAESVTAWARQYIQETIKKAEDHGFEVLYADTDSIFLKLNEKTEKDVLGFVEKINEKLPEEMELEYEGLYPRGLFVTKKEGTAAKKKYALIREDGTIEIKGFELVRRDWSSIAKKTQEEVIQAILKEGEPEKAIAIVKDVIQRLRDRKVETKDLIIYTQLKRKLTSYEQQAPHVKAAKKLINAGHKVKVGDLLEFVVVSGSGSISDRSIPVQLLENKKYDPEYYIENQILPPVMKILHELGVNENQLRFKGTQTGLGAWS